MENVLVEWNEIRQDMRDADSILSTTQVCHPVSPDGVAQLPVTEAFLEGVNAQRKRLQTRKLQMHRQSMDWGQKPGSQGDTMNSGSQTVLEEGNYHIGCLRKKWDRKTTYVRGHQRMLSPQKMPWISYYFLKEPGEGNKVSSMYTSKFVEWYGRSGEYGDFIGKGLLLCLNILLFLCGLMSLLFLFVLVVLVLNILFTPTFDFEGFFVIFGILVMLFPFVVGTVITIAVKGKCKRLKIRRLVSRKVTGQLHERVSDFCLEKFLGILNNKVLRLIYADGVEDVGDLISCDMAGFLQEHADVVNCEFQNFWFIDFREDKDYMYLDMSYRVFLDRDLGDQIGFSSENIVLQLARPLQGIMEADFYNDWSVINIETKKK
ncbi:MAG: hypothetical protein IKK33_02850 [Lachnospiraceae bacterium]|nr:hypothetical protein [Lachnospiraceae bacterium]